ncbi:ENTH domain protein [Necator americanus]|uniref:ENTH domain protein n=1 Tax=Necator americanus TaxID=51031 RepID=W2U0Z1_NECAM|nr:ENTH domain protein [Necator americanus]ETN86982.1 ENTH domain protein [Necator americanus]
MSISTIRRQVKNVAYNFSDAQVKVREATCNDPWGPSTALMSEISDLTNNPMAFTEVMSIIWKRLNDSGKNWRHVYKSLVLLDFLIKCGNDKVSQQCRENIFTIETLKDFQHIEDNRDQGLNIREKAKQITALLTDEERLKNERTRFMLTRTKFRENSALGVGSERRIQRSETGNPLDPEIEDARPSSIGEEEMQLQIAIALSKEEHEKIDEMMRSDEVRLQLALEESQREAERMAKMEPKTVNSGQLTQSALDDLLSLGVGEVVASEQPTSSTAAWANTGLVDPWASASPPRSTSSNLYSIGQVMNNDPWLPSTGKPLLATTNAPVSILKQSSAIDPFSTWEQQLDPTPNVEVSHSSAMTNGSVISGPRKTPENFLGENSSLVNLDNLLGVSSSNNSSCANPFLGNSSSSTNPFAAQQRKSPTLNEMRAAQTASIPPIPLVGPRVGVQGQPSQSAQESNPFGSPF